MVATVQQIIGKINPRLWSYMFQKQVLLSQQIIKKQNSNLKKILRIKNTSL